MVGWRLIRWDVLERRDYQVNAAREILEHGENTLVVMPTGLGKTAVGVLVIAGVLEESGGQALMLAPTVPLVEQHARFIERVMRGVSVLELTGRVKPDERETLWKKADVVVATPHVVRNDVIEGRVDPSRFTVTVFDEAHRAVGGYPYVYVARELDGLIVGLTASPGSDVERVQEVVRNLGIERIIVKTEDDPDVKPYLGRVDVEWVDVELPDWFEEAREGLQRAYKRRLETLKDMGFLDRTSRVWTGKLLSLREELRELKARRRERADFYSRALGVVAEALRLAKGREILETQGVGPFLRYFERLREKRGGMALKRVLGDPDFQRAVKVAKRAANEGKPDHPKLPRVLELVEEAETGLVFTQYTDTAKLLRRFLESEGVSTSLLLGKQHMSEREQLEAINRVRTGEARVLISTSVGEEGLDLPACDRVVLYEPVPSEIRTVQRIGRTARDGASGTAYVLVSRGRFSTLDEIYFYVSRARERKMLRVVRKVQERLRSRGGEGRPSRGGRRVVRRKGRGRTRGSVSLREFIRSSGGRGEREEEEERVPPHVPTILVDSREMNTKVVEHLRRRPVRLERDNLEVADYVIGERVGVERKSERDFAESLKDGRLMDQARELAREFERPVLIVEGNPRREVEPESVDGALAALAVDFGLTVLQSSGPGETAELLYRMARRVARDERPAQPRRRRSVDDLRVEMLSCIPGVGPELARRLLERFGSVGEVVTADVSELKRVEGIGERRAREIRKFLWGREGGGG